jgi:hypothetical protein
MKKRCTEEQIAKSLKEVYEKAIDRPSGVGK